MKKQYAIDLLGGTPTRAAKVIGCTPQAISAWPDDLTERLEALVMFNQKKLPSKTRLELMGLAEMNKAKA